MQIIYICSGCSPAKYREYVESRGQRAQQQSQKYNQLLMEGLVENDIHVTTISTRPINRSLTKQVFFKSEQDQEKGIRYYYVPFFNLPVLRNISVLLSVFYKILFLKKQKDTVLLCDGLNIAAAAAAIPAAKLCGIKTVGIVTDVPCHRPDNQKIPIHERINLWLMKRFDSYLLLTKQMNDIVNPQKRPFVVLEGHADISMRERENRLEDKNPVRVCMYAGSLRRIYGIEYLTKGFLAADIPNTELHIYGDGDYANELRELSKEGRNIKYWGAVPNNEVVRAELAATLLINPRPTKEDYTKYSFPSKNMEYMASGTPVLTTKLPGMPGDHHPYVYFIEEESTQGISESLKRVFSQGEEDLHAFGMRAKKYILENKSNVVQAQKVIRFLKENL